jgi:hypothetical protein
MEKMIVNELKTIMTRSFFGYLLTPETAFGEDQEKSVLSAFSFLFPFLSFLFWFFRLPVS